MNQDTRIPVVLGQQPGPGDAMLVEEGLAAPDGVYALRFAVAPPLHAFGCACCTRQNTAAVALGLVFRARATGAAPFFSRIAVRASAAGDALVREALAGDAVTSARYRLVEL
jgi:hypothetical protein